MDRVTRRQVLRRMVALCAGTVAAGALTSCAPKPSPSATTSTGQQTSQQSPATPDHIKLVFASYFGASGTEAETLKALIENAEAQTPGLEVELLLPESNYADKILAMFAAKQAPDVFLMNSTELGTYVEKQVVLDLTDQAQKDASTYNDYFTIGLQAYTIGGRLWALPVTLQPLIQFVNTKLFRDAGLDLPPKDWNDKSWTMDKFVETAIALCRDDGSGKRVQFGYHLNRSIARWCHLLWSFGADMFDDMNDPKEFTFTAKSQGVLDTLQLLQDLAVTYHVGPQDAEIQGQKAPDWFVAGKVGIFHEGIWYIGDFSRVEDPNFEWTAAVTPLGPAGRFCRIGGDGAAVSTQSKYPELGWQLVGNLYTGDALKKEAFKAENTITVPTRKSAARSPEYLAFFDAQTRALWTDSLDHGKVLPMHPRLAQVWQEALQPQIDALFLGTKKPAEILPEIEEKANEVLTQP